MIRLRFFNILAFLLLTLVPAGAQFYNSGQDPGSLNWEQINTEHFRVIFPSESKPIADRVTNLLEMHYEANSKYLDHRPAKIPVIIHNESVLSNGYVAWAPKRMELVTTPDATGIAQDHLEQLTLHEFRHVMQIDKLRQGFTRGLSYVIGQAGTGAVAGMLPFWYLEGDATDAETRLSYAGRGRVPAFEMGIKAIMLDVPEMYPYEKAVFGSYRDYIPNHYEYGFQMVAHGRKKYGNALWEEVVNNVGRRPYTLYPNYFSLKKYTGLTKTGFYEETFKTLRDHWMTLSEERSLSSFQKLHTEEKRYFTSYLFPRYVNDSVVFAEKSGIDQINEFILLNRDGSEKRIHRPGYYDGASINVEGHRVIWSEIIRDPRWARRSWSVIKIYDMDIRQERILSPRTRYYAPDISEDGNFIVTVEADPQNRIFLVILHGITGEVISRVESPDNLFLQYPVWNDDHTKVYLSAMGEKGKSIMVFDPGSVLWEELFESGFEDISQLFCKGDYLLFRGSFSGIDNIYALDLKSRKVSRVTSSRFGAYTPSLSPGGDTLIYSDYSSMGFDLVHTAFNPGEFTPIDDVSNPGEQLNVPEKEEEEAVIPSGGPGESYTAKKYHKAGNLFNFHSWAPVYVDINDPSIENLPVSPGLMLVSQNLLSTATTVLGYEYNLETRDHFLHTSFTYSGWYPTLEVGLDYGGRPSVAPPPDTALSLKTFRTDLNIRTKAELPLNLSYNRYVMGARTSVEGRFSRAYLYSNDEARYKSGLTFLDYRLYYYAYLKKSKRDILPRFGGVLDLRYVNTPFESEQTGSNSLISGTLYLPGPLRHQTFRVYAGRQQQEPLRYLMANLMSLPRGYHNSPAIGLRKVSLDYVFPIGYPDWQIWRAAYFKRFRGSVFYDYAIGEQVYESGNRGPVNDTYRSLGIELTTDMNFAQIFVPFNIGGRFIYIPDTRNTAWEFVFSVDLGGI